jgi:nucleotide-binding universal stress UspA family protein
MSKHVVVAYDFSDSSKVALERAIDLACRAPEHVLHVVAVIDHDQDYHFAEQVQQQLLDQLRETFAQRSTSGEVHFFVHARIGSAAEEILDLASEIGADMIVIGSHGRTGMRRVLLGSVSETVVRRARCAVIVARAKGYPSVELEHIVDAPHPAGHRRPTPHRYSYSSSMVQTRPNYWPLN